MFFGVLIVCVMVAMANIIVSSAASSQRNRSYFCEKGEYHLHCREGTSLKIYAAWFGRFAGDHVNCILPRGDRVDSPTLARTCGSSVQKLVGSLCSEATDGCTLQVVSLDVNDGEGHMPCPRNTTRYLYIEFECSRACVSTDVTTCAMFLTLSALAFVLSSFLAAW